MLTQLDRARTPERPVDDTPERLIFVSNRAPIEHHFDDIRGITRIDSGGGVATALASVANEVPVTWLASPATDADRSLALAGRTSALGGRSELRFVDVPKDAYHLFYDVFCNPLLWFVQHGLAHRLRIDPASSQTWQAWNLGYRRVNAIYAEAIAEELARGQGYGVMLHDYHFYLAPRMVRERCPEAVLQHFIHIPWPALHLWEALPRAMVESICRGLLGNDSLVFQTDESVANFLATCAVYLKDEAAVSTSAGEVRHGGHITNVWSNPISVDVAGLREAVESEAAAPWYRKVERELGQQTIVRVDRLDPSKNICTGFRAFGRLLESQPELRGKVRMLAFLVPSRTSIPEYQAYRDEVFALVRSINDRHGDADWQPIKVFHEHNRLQALVALTSYDVLLVNSVMDGMNLVSKEGAVLNQRDGVLVLSETAGSHEELRTGALTVSPGDVGGTAEALGRALRMEPAERRARAANLRDTIERHQIRDWLRLQLKDFAITEYLRALPAAR